jgi:transmembrane sensor
MKLSDKKNLYHRFLNKELDAAALEEFFMLVEQGEFDEDYQEVMPELEEEPAVPLPVKTRPTFTLFTKIAIAASLLLISGLGYISYRRAEELKKQNTFAVITVPVGSMKLITLTDRSVVTLTSGSVFKYPLAFTSRDRKVYLIKGKAFFEIAKDKTKPFTVYSAKLSTTALGTSFTVENYQAYQLEKIKLYTGKVEIGSKDKGFLPVQLNPGQQYTQSTRVSGKTIFENATEVTSYTEDGALAFDGTSLSEALISIASYYNVSLQFKKEDLRDYAINGRFSNEPIEDVLHTLLFTHHLRFKKIPEGYHIMK